jgi:hypothetical protein
MPGCSIDERATMKLWRLSLRDLFWLVALVAMGCGWCVDRATIADRENAVVDGEQAARAFEAKSKDELRLLYEMLRQWQAEKSRVLGQTRPLKIDPIPVSIP